MVRMTAASTPEGQEAPQGLQCEETIKSPAQLGRPAHRILVADAACEIVW